MAGYWAYKGPTFHRFRDGGRPGSPDGDGCPTDTLRGREIAQSRVSTAEQKLMLAVLEAAIHDLQKYAHSTHPRARALYEDARDFIRGELTRSVWREREEPRPVFPHSWPFAFEAICDALGFEASALRSKLLPPPVSPRAAFHANVRHAEQQ